MRRLVPSAHQPLLHALAAPLIHQVHDHVHVRKLQRRQLAARVAIGEAAGEGVVQRVEVVAHNVVDVHRGVGVLRIVVIVVDVVEIVVVVAKLVRVLRRRRKVVVEHDLVRPQHERRRDVRHHRYPSLRFPVSTLEIDGLLLDRLAHEAREVLLDPRQALSFPALPRGPLVPAPRLRGDPAQRRGSRERDAQRVGKQAAEPSGRGGGEVERRRAAQERRIDVFVDEGGRGGGEDDGLHAGVRLHARVFDGALQLREEADAVLGDADQGGRDDLGGEEEWEKATAKTNSREGAVFLMIA